MMNRREALLTISAAAVTFAAPSSSALAEVLHPSLPLAEADPGVPTDQVAANQAADDELRADLAGMVNRADSEEGVPVLLACVNLVRDASSGRVPQVKLTAMNKAVVADFLTTAAAWQRIKPAATEGDVGNLIQVLAVRDFASHGKGAK
jgi:hypothetical protein